MEHEMQGLLDSSKEHEPASNKIGKNAGQQKEDARCLLSMLLSADE